MKKKFLKLLQMSLLAIATLSANTPSQISLYQPSVPNKLKGLKQPITMVKLRQLRGKEYEYIDYR